MLLLAAFEGLDPKWPQESCSIPPAHPSAHTVVTSTLPAYFRNPKFCTDPALPPDKVQSDEMSDRGWPIADATPMLSGVPTKA